MMFSTCWLILYLCFFLYFCTRIYKFFCKSKKDNAIILTRKSSIYGMLSGVCITLIIMITSIYKYGIIVSDDNPLSIFVLFSIPMIINCRVFLLLDLFAFKDNVIIGDNLKVDLKDLKIQSVKPISFKMVWIETMFDNNKTKKKQKLFLRIPKNSYEILKTRI